jgi:hypothetical protein
MITALHVQTHHKNNMVLLRNAPKSVISASLSKEIVAQNAASYPYVNTDALSDEEIQKAIANMPANAIYTPAERISEKTLAGISIAEAFGSFCVQFSAEQQRKLCQLEPRLIVKCERLSNEDLFNLLPLVKDDDTKAYIMNILGRS